METFPAGCSEIVILWVAGVVDLSTYRSLSTALAGCVDLHPRYLVVDLSAITFCGVRGMTLLGDTARVTDGVARVAVSGLSACLDRVATMLWEPGLPTRTRSVAVAVTAFRAEQAQHEETLRG